MEALRQKPQNEVLLLWSEQFNTSERIQRRNPF